jgi:uncharacterized membrane protein YsdA (DUF1294 family)
MTVIKFFLFYVALLSLFAFILYGVDKAKARRGAWRISEKALLLCGFLGGAAGALVAMQLFRHKTKHPQFSIGIPVMLVLHIVLVVVLYILF